MFAEQPVEAFEQAVEAQHHALRDILGELTPVLANSIWEPEELAELLKQLREHLREHFEVEEDGGYFHDALAILPQLRPQAVALQRQHAEYLATVERVLGRLAMEELAAETRRAIEVDLRKFVESMRKHDTDEVKLLQLAYNQDLGSSD